MENESELDRIFEDKLFIKKKEPGILTEKSINKPIKETLDNSRLISDMKDFSHEDGYNKINTIYDKDIELPDISLKGIYNDEIDKENRQEMRVTFADDFMKADKRQKENIPIRVVDIKKTEDNNKIKEIEEEFEKLKQTHLKALKMKSKIYQFVYSEIERMENDHLKQIEELKKENSILKEELKRMSIKYEKYKEYVFNNLKKLKLRFIEAINSYRKSS